MKKLLVVVLLLPAAGLAALYFLSGHSIVGFDSPPKVISSDTPVRVRVTNSHGVRRLTAGVEQNGVRHTLYQKTEPPSRWLFWRRSEAPREARFSVGLKSVPSLKAGAARLYVESTSNDFGAAEDSAVAEVQVVTEPLRVTADGLQHYINQGGCELVLLTPSGAWTEAGVRVGKQTFRSFPLPGSTKGERFSLFAFSWDTPADTEPVVYARDAGGAEVTARFWHKVFPKKFKSRDLAIDERFVTKVVNQIEPGGAGSLLDRFLRINGAMRHRDNEVLANLKLKTEERFLWTEPFAQEANSKVESSFADRRTYVYEGKKVDQQVHLGFDLSVTKNVAVQAANSGKVVYAGNLGIYGNCVVVDHGYGLQSIYGHLSEIGVKDGESVKKGQALGRSGATGLAGGDHLHFSMQAGGVQINPVEWWDKHWIQDRIHSKVK